MNKPDQYMLNICAECIEYIIADMKANEPYAINSIHVQLNHAQVLCVHTCCTQ